MRNNVTINTLLITASNHSDCAHGCRYCPIARKQSPIALSRYERFVGRVQEWIAREQPGYPLYHGLGYHGDFNREDLETLRRLKGGTEALTGITLGGLPWRDDAALSDWLTMLKDFGLRSVHATFSGYGDTHDHWNNKAGNFDLLMRTLKVSGRFGLNLGQRLLVGRSTLPGLERLLDDLETLPKKEGDWRYAMPFYYMSVHQKAQPHVETDRMDEAEREAMPPRLRTLYTPKKGRSNLSEREWIAFIDAEDEPGSETDLIIRISAKTIDMLEATPVADIIAGLERRARAAYAAMPTRRELREAYGDTSNTALYALARCVEMKWLDRYRADHPEVHFEQHLTHCWFGA